MLAMIKEVDLELSYKSGVSVEEKSLLVNSNVFMILSGQKSHFFEERKYWESELKRLGDILQSTEREKKYFEEKYKENYDELINIKFTYEKEIKIIRDRVSML